jgi:tetratricopeptide (TPR) repeat protein
MDEELEDLSGQAALDAVAALIDRGSDTADPDLSERALRLSAMLLERKTLSGPEEVLLHYFRANAFENKLRSSGGAQSWLWELADLDQVQLELRRAVRHAAFPVMDPLRQCQILTNLGSSLNTVGRPIEALEQWDAALRVNPSFAAALGNRGHGLISYASSLYDSGHSGLLMLAAHDSLTATSAEVACYDSEEMFEHRHSFQEMAAQISDQLDLETAREDLVRPYSLGRSRRERSYRTWVLEQRLFLNPLNDLGTFSIAARDILHLPSLSTGFAHGPGPPLAFGFYNQLKQEYVSARWLAFEGVSEHRPHFSDRDTNLYDTLSIPAYGLAVEKAKLALRMAYSLLDKIAYFINDYFQVGLPERAVSFRSVWLERKGDPRPLSTHFRSRANWPLRGLYWLSKDVHEPAFQAVAEPEAAGLADLRNHLEHKYCQVHEDLGVGYSRFATDRNGEDASFHIGRDLLEGKMLQVLKKARAALIYLSLAVHREELAREAERGDGFVIESPLSIWRERGRL